MDVLTAFMMVFRQFSLCIAVPSNLQLILTTHNQFREYFDIIDATKDGKAKFNKILEVRVEERDKKKILEARDKERKNQGKPPQCIKEVLVEPNKDEPKGRKKKPETKNVFGE